MIQAVRHKVPKALKLELLVWLRLGYFVADRLDHVAGAKPVFNRVTGLKDSWGK